MFKCSLKVIWGDVLESAVSESSRCDGLVGLGCCGLVPRSQACSSTFAVVTDRVAGTFRILRAIGRITTLNFEKCYPWVGSSFVVVKQIGTYTVGCDFRGIFWMQLWRF